MYLLDTNIIIDFLRGNTKIVELVKSMQNGSLHISSVTIAEYYQGAVGSTNPQKSIEYFNELVKAGQIQIIPIGHEIAQIYGLLQGEFHAKGKAKPILDLFIAATCIAHDLSLVTLDKKDFTDFKKLKILKI